MRFNERIVIDGEPISDEALARNWDDIAALPRRSSTPSSSRAGEPPLTFFEALTVLAFACFADAPVDVAVIEVGMGGEWDSTNVADGQVAVFTPISLDHTKRLGNTIAEIARTKSGIIKPAADVVSAAQPAEALAELERAAELTESTLRRAAGRRSTCRRQRVAVGGQLVTHPGPWPATYDELFLPLYGDHQAQNAAVAIAAVETFLGGGTQPLNRDVLEEGFATATSPGRLQLIGIEPTVLVDAAHNPGGAAGARGGAARRTSTSTRSSSVFGVLADKDAARHRARARARRRPVRRHAVALRPGDRRRRARRRSCVEATDGARPFVFAELERRARRAPATGPPKQPRRARRRDRLDHARRRRDGDRRRPRLEGDS